MSYFTQMAGLAWHNFVSAAAGVAVAVAVVRGVTRTTQKTLGSFWVDLTRSCLYIFLPISIVGGLFLCWTGVPQNFNAYQTVTTIDGGQQTITGGPMASQEIIKELGTNGGGFVNANSASPNENPTPLSNFFEMLMIFLVSAGLVYMYGKMAGDTRQGWAIFAAMAMLFFGGFTLAYASEAAGNPLVHQLGVAGREHGRQRVPFRHPRIDALRHDHDRYVVRRGELDARFATCRSADSCRWSTCNSARSSSAEPEADSTAC